MLLLVSHIDSPKTVQDPSLPVRRNAGHVVSTVAGTIADNYSELLKDGEMPELPGLCDDNEPTLVLYL